MMKKLKKSKIKMKLIILKNNKIKKKKLKPYKILLKLKQSQKNLNKKNLLKNQNWK